MNNKPVYQIDVSKTGVWFECTQEQFEEIKSSGAAFVDFRILYPSAAYEALKAKVECLEGKIELDQAKLRGEEETVKRVVAHSEALKAENATQAKRIAELEDLLSAFPIPTYMAMQKIGKLRQEGFKEYAATVLNKENQYCIVGDYGDVRWASKNGDSK